MEFSVKYTQVELLDAGSYERIAMRGMEEGREYIYEIPFQAIADRMELYGLESVEQSLEFIGREIAQPDVADKLRPGVVEAYGAVTQSEFAQSMMPHPMTDLAIMGQTLMPALRIADHKRSALTEQRTSFLQLMGMRSKIHSRPALRMMDDTRPVETTVPAAAEALDADTEVVTRAVKMAQESAELLEAWRMETVMSHVPQMRAYLKDRESVLART